MGNNHVLFCHRCARKIWIRLIFSVGILPCLNNVVSIEAGWLAGCQNKRSGLHEDTRQIQLYLETNIDVCTIDGRTPPEREPTIRDLVQTRALGVGEFLVPHGLLETGCLLPEETWVRMSDERCDILRAKFAYPPT